MGGQGQNPLGGILQSLLGQNYQGPLYGPEDASWQTMLHLQAMRQQGLVDDLSRAIERGDLRNLLTGDIMPQKSRPLPQRQELPYLQKEKQ